MQTNRVLTGDCLELLPRQPEASVDLAFADPPFNIGYDYDVYDDHQAKADYLAWTEKWLSAVRRVLKPTASFWVAIGDEYAAETKVRLDALGLTLRNWIVWHYTFGVHCTKKFTRSHAHIFYYVVDPKRFTFHADAVRVPSARQTTYADRRANPKGRVPDDTWVLRPQEDERLFPPESDTWYVSLAVSLLQLPADRLLFIGLYDNTVPAAGFLFDVVVNAIALVMWRLDCNVICAPWQPNAQGDCQAIQGIAASVAKKTGVGLIWHAVPASHSPGRPMVTDPPTAGYRLDIAPHLPAKRRAIAAHESQFGRLIADDPRDQRPSKRILAACDRPYEIFLCTN